MDPEELQLELERRVNEYMRRTLPIDVVYAVLCAALFGFVGGFVVGTDCPERFLSRCVAYIVRPIRFASGFVAAGAPAFWMSLKALRGQRRRKGWFG